MVWLRCCRVEISQSRSSSSDRIVIVVTEGTADVLVTSAGCDQRHEQYASLPRPEAPGEYGARRFQVHPAPAAVQRHDRTGVHPRADQHHNPSADELADRFHHDGVRIPRASGL